jgi:hypothetical protein
VFNVKSGLVPLTGLLVAGGLLLTGCAGGGDLTWGQSAPTPPTSSATPTPEATSDPDLEEATDLSTVHAPSILDNWFYPADYVALIQKYDNTPDNARDDTWDYTFLDADTGKAIKTETFPVLQAGNNDQDKFWPDSIEGPVESKTGEELIVDVLTKPDVCGQAAVGLYNAVWVTPEGTLISVADNNPWIKKWFPTDIADVTAWAADVLSGDQLEQLRDAKKCSLVGLLLKNLVDGGVHVYTTVMNYHVSEQSAATVYGLATDPFHVIGDFELNPRQYTGEFIVFEFQLKGWPSNCNNQILFNTGDGRFARPDCTPPDMPPYGDCRDNCGTPVPDCYSVYGNAFPNGTYPLCKDGEGNDPSNNGNNLPGGNDSSGLQLDAEGGPAGGNPAGSYTPPAAVISSDAPIGSTKTEEKATTESEGGTGLN